MAATRRLIKVEGGDEVSPVMKAFGELTSEEQGGKQIIRMLSGGYSDGNVLSLSSHCSKFCFSSAKVLRECRGNSAEEFRNFDGIANFLFGIWIVEII